MTVSAVMGVTLTHTDPADKPSPPVTINKGERVKQTLGTPTRRMGRFAAVAIVGLGLIAGACSKKDSGASTTASETTAASVTTAAGGDTTVASTEAATTTVAKKKPVMGGTITVSGEAEVANAWTPASMQCDMYCYERALSFFDPLMTVNADHKVVGYLVDKFEPNADFTVWTFTLRSGIKFTDGTPVDAKAAVRNLQDSGTGLLISKAITDVGRNPDQSLAIEATGDLTFTIKTGHNGDLANPIPWPNLPSILTGQLGLIASPAWLDAVKAGTADKAAPIGSGPFLVESYAPQEKLVVKRNPNYWQKDADGNQLPYLDGITFRVIQDSETAGEALKNGDIDAFSTSSAVVINEYRKMADQFPMHEQDQFGETNYILIDLAKPGPLQDARVRCALQKAENRQELIDLTADGILKVANGIFSPGQEGYLADNGSSTEQDIEGAKALIADYQKDHPGPIEVKYGTTVTNINAQVAELLKGYWAQIGVTTNIVQVPQDQFITKALFGDPDFQMFGWRQHAGTFIDSQYFWWHSSGSAPDGQLSLNFARLNDPIIDKALEDQRKESDPAKRKALAEEVNKQMAKECYNLPGSWTIWGTPHKAAVQGLNGSYILPDGSTSLDGGFAAGGFWLTGAWLDKAAG